MQVRVWHCGINRGVAKHSSDSFCLILPKKVITGLNGNVNAVLWILLTYLEERANKFFFTLHRIICVIIPFLMV